MSLKVWTENDRLLERSQEITDICNDINQIHEIYGDLALIVQSQKENINKIEDDVDQSKIHTEKAVSHLLDAQRYQSTTRWVFVGAITGAAIGGPVAALGGLKLMSFVVAVGGGALGSIIGRFAG